MSARLASLSSPFATADSDVLEVMRASSLAATVRLPASVLTLRPAPLMWASARLLTMLLASTKPSARPLGLGAAVLPAPAVLPEPAVLPPVVLPELSAESLPVAADASELVSLDR